MNFGGYTGLVWEKPKYISCLKSVKLSKEKEILKFKGLACKFALLKVYQSLPNGYTKVMKLTKLLSLPQQLSALLVKLSNILNLLIFVVVSINWKCLTVGLCVQIVIVSILHIKLSLLTGGLLLLFVGLSSPHPANSPMIISTPNIASTAATNLLFKFNGSNSKGFLMAYKDKMFKCCFIFLNGLTTYVIAGLIPGLFFTLLMPMLYSSTDFGVNASLRFMGNISINTSMYFLNQLMLSVCNSVTRTEIVLICFCVVLFCLIVKIIKRAPLLITSCMIPIGMLAKSFEAHIHGLCGSLVSYISKIYNSLSFVKCDFPLMLKKA